MDISLNRIEPAPIVKLDQLDPKRGLLFHLIALIPILIVYISLAFYHIGHQSLWLDEVISVKVASGDSFFSPVIWFRQSPLYFALLHLWVKLGTSEFVLRSLSVVFGGIGICLTYVLGLRFFNQRVTLIGATILATSPFFIWYSQEVRYITLMMATSLIAMYTFHRALSTKHRGWWLSYICSLIVAIAAFKVNILLPFAQGLYLLCSPSHRPVLRKWLVCQMVVFALFTWWINGGQLQQLGGGWKELVHDVTVSDEPKLLSSGGNRPFELAAIPYTFFTFSTGFSMGPSVRDLQASRSITPLMPYAPLLLCLGVLFGGLFVAGVTALWRRPDRGMFFNFWLFVPIIGALLVSLVTEMAYNVRYVAMALPAYIFIVTAGIMRFRRPIAQITLFVFVLIVNGIALSNYYFEPRYAREDSRSAAQYLKSAARPRDLILIVGKKRALRYYYKGDSQMLSWSRKHGSDQISVKDRIIRLGENYDRVWLLEIRRWHRDPTGRVKKTLEELYTVSNYQHFAGVDIHSYDVQSK